MTGKVGRVVALLPWLWLSACSQKAIKPVEPQAVTKASSGTVAVHITLRETRKSSTRDSSPARTIDNLWDRLFALYRLPEVDHPRVKRELRWYLSHPEYLQRVQRRARPYLYTIVSEIERAGLPGELALLPVVESAFRPEAYSRMRAAGLWQFIPSTGRLYGLKQNWWIDLRRDVHASTRAAIRYLKKLHTDFHGDWLLALAAYNAGEGTVMRAIRRNHRLHRPTDFWHLRLPRETRSYVPKLLAVARVFSHAEEYGISLIPIPNRPLYAQVRLDSQIDLNLAAELAEMPLEELYRLNPGYRRWATAPDGPHRLILPLEKVALFQERLAKLPQSRRIRWERHRVRRGETLAQIAKRYHTPVAVIRQANHLKGNRIYPGQPLVIPVVQDVSETLLARLKKIPVRPYTPPVKIHVVRRGDTLWEIARRYGVRISQLARWNRLNPKRPLRPGQRLRIETRLAEAGNPFRSVVYTVRKGDSLYKIARRFGVRMQDLHQWNRRRLKGTLQPGQRIRVYLNHSSG